MSVVQHLNFETIPNQKRHVYIGRFSAVVELYIGFQHDCRCTYSI